MCIIMKSVSYEYRTRFQKVQAVSNVSCTFESGQMYAITGESGSGKSTLLSLLAGLDVPSSGSILVDGVDTRRLNRDKYRQKMASVIYQSFHLLPLLTAFENVMLPMELNHVARLERKQFAIECLHRMGIDNTVMNKFPKMLSGGEQQRVAIARAVAAGGRILLADEPTGNLDSENEEIVINILEQLAHEEKFLVIVVTHNTYFANQADVVYRMKDGAIIQTG